MRNRLAAHRVKLLLAKLASKPSDSGCVRAWLLPEPHCANNWPVPS